MTSSDIKRHQVTYKWHWVTLRDFRRIWEVLGISGKHLQARRHQLSRCRATSPQWMPQQKRREHIWWCQTTLGRCLADVNLRGPEGESSLTGVIWHESQFSKQNKGSNSRISGSYKLKTHHTHHCSCMQKDFLLPQSLESNAPKRFGFVRRSNHM